MEILKHEADRIRYQKMEIKKGLHKLKIEERNIGKQREEVEYSKQQIDRAYLKIKKERVKLAQEAKTMDQMLKAFQELLYKSKIL